MSYWTNIQPGTKIELLSLAPKPDEEEAKIYITKVEKTKGQKEIIVLMPIDKGKIISLPLGANYIVTFYTNIGMAEAEFTVKRRFSADNNYFILLERVSMLIKKQRREFYRLECNRNVEFRIMEEEERLMREKLREDRFEDPAEKAGGVAFLMEKELQPEWHSAVMLDLGGGGLRIKTEKIDGLDQNLMLRLVLPIEGKDTIFDLECVPLSFTGIIGQYNMVEIRCKFAYISNLKQEMLVRFIYSEQIKIRAKALE